MSTEALGHAGAKRPSSWRAACVRDRRRAGPRLEWSAALGTWSMLAPNAFIEDPVFAAPLHIEALVRAAETDDAVAHALLIKRNAVIEAARAQGAGQGVAEGVTRGRAESLIAVLDARGLAMAAAERTRILGERDPSMLARWLARAATCTDLAEVFADDYRQREADQTQTCGLDSQTSDF